jgi:hypothetical protein
LHARPEEQDAGQRRRRRPDAARHSRTALAPCVTQHAGYLDELVAAQAAAF